MRTFSIFTLSIITIVLVACVAPIKDLTKTQYLNPSFNAIALNQGGLALLPITAGQGQEGYRRPLGDFLNQNLQASVPKGKVLTWQQTMDSLNQNSKVKVYEDLILSYHQTSILNRDNVKELSGTLGVRYALYCALQDYSKQTNTSYNIFSGYNTTETANVESHCLIIDLQTGDVMQEIIGQATSQAGELSTTQAYEEFAKVMANSILMQLPGSSIKPPKKEY